MSEMNEKRENNVIIRKEENYNSTNLFTECNKAWVSGVIEEELEFDHRVLWENFYKTRVKVKRLSGVEDYIPIIISEFLLTKDFNRNLKGKIVEVGGQFRSYNKMEEDGKKHLKLFLFATVINIYEDEDEVEDVINANLVYFDGYICKKPLYRETLLGRQITDLLIAVNRAYNQSDYIPCISWGRNAKYADNLEVGDHIKLYGRIQSRDYFKKFSRESEAGEYRTAYEVSVMRMAKIEDLRLEVSDK